MSHLVTWCKSGKLNAEASRVQGAASPSLSSGIVLLMSSAAPWSNSHLQASKLSPHNAAVNMGKNSEVNSSSRVPAPLTYSHRIIGRSPFPAKCPIGLIASRPLFLNSVTLSGSNPAPIIFSRAVTSSSTGPPASRSRRRLMRSGPSPPPPPMEASVPADEAIAKSINLAKISSTTLP